MMNKLHKSGFALIVVLSSLVIISILYTIVATSNISRVISHKTTEQAASNQHQKRALLLLCAEIVGRSGERIDPRQPFGLSIGHRAYTISLRDVGGLVDLNTANPELLEHFLKTFGLSEPEVRDYRKWRRAPNRAQRIRDLTHIAKMDPQRLQQLRSLSTVNSGRAGISIDDAPDALKTILGSQLQRWSSPPSGEIFQVWATEDANAPELLGVVSISSQQNPGRVLVVY